VCSWRARDLPGVGYLLFSLRWYDIVCINQADNDEKSEQVAKMRSIYERAKQVIIWLGPSADGMRDIIQASGDRLVDIKVRLDVIFREFDHLFPDRFLQTAYLAFSQRRWWKRV
jgi:hypothetical protein